MKIDLYDPASFAAGHPFDQYAWLRENDPVHWHEEPDGPGFWAVTRYDDVYSVDRNFQAFSSEPTIMIQDAPDQQQSFGGYKMMLMMDPPQHTAYRKLIRNEFTQPAATPRTPRMQALARRIVDAVIERGECDFVSDIAGEMPSFVIAELMGLPLDDGRELYKLTEIIHTAPQALPPGTQLGALQKMFEYGRGVIAEKRARPSNDLATKLLQAEVDGKRLDDIEFLLFFLLLVDAGGDTTRNLLSSGLIALLERPEKLAWLQADLAGRLPSAREELLRWCTPVIYMRRTARHDVELGGKQIREGQKAVMYFASANRDPRKFENPDVLDLTRSPNPHIAFGTGPHGCLGQHIARIEIDAVLTEVLTRMDGLEIVGAPEWLASSFISGPKQMRVRYRPAPRLAA
ncbi:MAG: cytochrome P450 [Alphaproteobacteria bacterium]|nr:cytochrome P450 [Alphaproteobacteria bacterium]MBN9567572.1 cytochrome P450 [Alphaproteobacteria bacterium]MBN9570971.1 cytochrome P450 [Alphaproteobacteria bacterium]MBN9578741.1 cytochrome P450 [Alphaproteobacteria bacterium]